MATRPQKSTAAPAARKTAAAKKVAQTKPTGGRPPKYNAKIHDPLARRLTMLGQTMTQMAEVFDVAESTIWDWKKKHAGFSEAVTCARAEADGRVAEAMFNSAIGGWIKESRTHVLKDKDGNQFVHITKVDKWLEADVGAQKNWLNNRQPGLWKAAPEEKSGEEVLPPITAVGFIGVDASGDPDSEDEDSDA